MIVSNLQQFLRLLAPPLAAAGINQPAQKSVTVSLEAVAAALEPFAQMSLDQLSEFLVVAQEYRTTGVIPDRAPPKRSGTTSPKPPKTIGLSHADALAKLKDIQHRSSGLETSQIAEEVQGLASLTVSQLKNVQREFLGAVVGKKKEEMLAAIRRKIDDFRASRDRVEGIRAQ